MFSGLLSHLIYGRIYFNHLRKTELLAHNTLQDLGQVDQGEVMPNPGVRLCFDSLGNLILIQVFRHTHTKKLLP